MRRPAVTGAALTLGAALVLASCSDGSGPEGPDDAAAPDDAVTSSAPGPAPGDDDPTSTPDATATTTPPVPDDDAGHTTAPAPDDTAQTTEPQTQELPGGGTEIFPEYLLYGYSGHPTAQALGRLGIGDLDERVEEISEGGEAYAGDRTVMPVLELIATMVHATPGEDGTYRTREADSVVEDYLAAARRHDGMLLLNIQPGRSSMLEEVQHWEEFLTEPDVGVALDPEWDIAEGQVPGEVYGETAGSELDDVSAYLAELVEENDLPQKVMVYHQVHRGVVTDPEDLRERDEVVVINSVDGIGAPGDKIDTYDAIMQDRPDFVVPGFKLFFEEDAELGPLMTPEEVVGLDPVPEYVLWE